MCGGGGGGGGGRFKLQRVSPKYGLKVLGLVGAAPKTCIIVYKLVGSRSNLKSSL